MGNSSVNSPNFFFSDKTNFVWQAPEVLLYLDNSFLVFVIYSSLSRKLFMFFFKGTRGQKWGVVVLYDDFGGAGDCAKFGDPISPSQALASAFRKKLSLSSRRPTDCP